LLDAKWTPAPPSIVTVGRHKFGQVAAKCGDAAINNLVGRRVVSADELHAIAAQQNERASKNKETLKHGDARGNWSPSVLRRALNDKGFRMDTVRTPGGNTPSHL
jgi:hypothetical protein